jgi:PadR family transcriptional regulator, regulatory protein PadR
VVLLPHHIELYYGEHYLTEYNEGEAMINSDIIRGHLDAIILRLIYEKDRYGYEISKEISQRTQDRFQIKEATLYAVFQRLEKRGLICSYDGDVSLGGKRRYYTIMPRGKTVLLEEMEQWKEVKEIIGIFMEDRQ